MIHFTLSNAISKIDSKGRVSIPVGIRYRFGLIEGSEVCFKVKDNDLILVPARGGWVLATKEKGGKIMELIIQKTINLLKDLEWLK